MNTLEYNSTNGQWGGKQMRRKLTVKRDQRDFRDLFYRSVNYVRESQLPRKVDLRSKLSPIVNQGNLGSCTSNAIVSGLREYWLRQESDSSLRLSRLFIIGTRDN